MKIKDLMTPVSEYTTVGPDASFAEVAAAMCNGSHQDVIVVDGNGDLVGLVTMTDVLGALEPNYKRLSKKHLDSDTLTRRYVADLFKEFGLWDDPLTELCKRGVSLKASEAMHVPAEAEYVNEEDNLAHAMHRYIVGVHQPLVVRNNGTITGILRLQDIFDEVKNRMLSCVDK